jgi:hypothetical protein
VVTRAVGFLHPAVLVFDLDGHVIQVEPFLHSAADGAYRERCIEHLLMISMAAAL